MVEISALLCGDTAVANENVVKIVVVDDDEGVVEAICLALSQAIADVKLSRAYDGNKAMSLIMSEQPRVVILDLMLPKRSGFLILERLKRERSNEPKVIMITANEGPRHKAYAEMLGVYEYIRKPFEMEVLVQAVQNALK